MPELGKRFLSAFAATRSHARAEHGRIHCACAGRADAVKSDAVVVEQAVEDTPGEGAMRAATLQGQVDQLGLGLWVRRCIEASRWTARHIGIHTVSSFWGHRRFRRPCRSSVENVRSRMAGGNAERVLCGCMSVIIASAARIASAPISQIFSNNSA